MSETHAADGVELRVATATDIPALFSVRTSVRENHLDVATLAERGVTPASIANGLSDPMVRTWVIEREHEVVGFSTADALRGSVFAVFVRPEMEVRGYGRALLRAAENWLFAAGWETIWLETGEEPQLRAHRFYRTGGWLLIGPADHGDVRYEKHRPI